MLILGFVWICLGQLAIDPIRRALVMHCNDWIPKQQSYKLVMFRELFQILFTCSSIFTHHFTSAVC